jgi:hypothetical protein
LIPTIVFSGLSASLSLTNSPAEASLSSRSACAALPPRLAMHGFDSKLVSPSP